MSSRGFSRIGFFQWTIRGSNLVRSGTWLGCLGHDDVFVPCSLCLSCALSLLWSVAAVSTNIGVPVVQIRAALEALDTVSTVSVSKHNVGTGFEW